MVIMANSDDGYDNKFDNKIDWLSIPLNSISSSMAVLTTNTMTTTMLRSAATICTSICKSADCLSTHLLIYCFLGQQICHSQIFHFCFFLSQLCMSVCSSVVSFLVCHLFFVFFDGIKSDDWTLVCLPSMDTWHDGWIHSPIPRLDKCIWCQKVLGLVSPDANPKPLPLETNVARCGWVGCLKTTANPYLQPLAMVSQRAPEMQNELSFPGVSGACGP
jgi:hypothetical protein